MQPSSSTDVQVTESGQQSTRKAEGDVVTDTCVDVGTESCLQSSINPLENNYPPQMSISSQHFTETMHCQNGVLTLPQETTTRSSDKATKKALRIYEKNQKQLSLFRNWDNNKDWGTFHKEHYDWWAFPVDQKSSYGFEFSVEPDVVSHLEALGFRKNLEECAVLVARAWGWDALQARQLHTQDPSQRWSLWPIRLYKMTKSLLIFNSQLYTPMRQYGLQVLERYGMANYKQIDFDKFFHTDFTKQAQQGER